MDAAVPVLVKTSVEPRVPDEAVPPSKVVSESVVDCKLLVEMREFVVEPAEGKFESPGPVVESKRDVKVVLDSKSDSSENEVCGS